ncbi:MAG TPA: hypothetical protein VM055_01030 [Novosphingobium sp.]|nr:hypothetical protein [Novosphingobium sp.]
MTRGSPLAVPPGPTTLRKAGRINAAPRRKSPRFESVIAPGRDDGASGKGKSFTPLL